MQNETTKKVEMEQRLGWTRINYMRDGKGGGGRCYYTKDLCSIHVHIKTMKYVWMVSCPQSEIYAVNNQWFGK